MKQTGNQTAVNSREAQEAYAKYKESKMNLRERCEKECTRDVVFLFQRRILQVVDIPDGWDFDGECFFTDGPEESRSVREMLESGDAISGEWDTTCILERWETEGVWLTREEAEQYGNAKHYNYMDGWRVYGVPSYGTLVDAIKGT